MKHLKIFSLILFSVLLYTSCGDTSTAEAKGVTRPGAKKEMAAKKKGQKTQNKAVKKGANTATQKPSNEAANYWPALQKDLKLSDKNITDLKNLRAKYRKQIQAVKDGKKANVKVQVKELKNKERAEMKKMLGADLFQKKLKWEKNRASAK